MRPYRKVQRLPYCPHFQEDNMDQSFLNTRYQRQVLLPGFGAEGQQKLSDAKILVLGVGGLGCPALFYLAAAGIGTLGIADSDVVSLSNLHRQVLFSMADIGRPKVLAAVAKLSALNPVVNYITYNESITTINALEILSKYDVIIDGSDNLATRYLVNDACMLLDKPLIYGAITQFEGQVAVFNCADQQGIKINYRHLFPDPPHPSTLGNCAEAGVLGILPGIIGIMQAAEAIKLITGIGKPLINTLFTYNALTNETFSFRINTSEVTNYPATPADFKKYSYEWFCEKITRVVEIDAINLREKITHGQGVIIDVREPGEQPLITNFSVLNVPLSQLAENFESIDGNQVIMVCQSGSRSLQAATILANFRNNENPVYSLKGGVLNAPFLFNQPG